jgi:diguanylate cyclase (GGDEF)-like protein/PAS domain S-box-containing protein
MKNLFEFSYTSYIFPLLLAFGLLTAVMTVTWRFRKTQLGRAFLYMLAALQVWTLGFAVEIAAIHLEGKLFWANLQFLGIFLLPMFWLEITLLFTGQTKKVRQYITLLSILVILELVMIWTNDLHHFFRLHPYIDCAAGPFCILSNDYGMLFYALASISYSLFLLSLVMMVRSLVITKPVYRQQLLLLVASLLLPLLTDFLYVLGVTPIPNFNFTPMTFSLVMVFVAIALFRFRLFSIRPLAYDMIIENLRDGILILDSDNTIVDINPAAQNLLGVSGKQVIGESVGILRKKMPAMVDQFLDVSSINTEVKVGEEGGERYFDVVISPVDGRGGESSGRTVTIHDTTERYKLYQKVERMAQTDPLTGLFNRRYFFEYGEQEFSRAIRYKKSLSLLMLDLDNFKWVNDTHGHAVGDYVLAEIPGILQKKLRRNDLLGRYGGEEFIILLPEIDISIAREVAERLRETIAAYPMLTGETMFTITASIGVAALVHAETESFSSLIYTADMALYRAKSLGKNRVEG